MKKYVKMFFLRGMMFGGFGPIVAGIVYAIHERGDTGLHLNGDEVFLAIVSTYFLAFFHAGASIFPQIEHWPLLRILVFHFLTLYTAYAGCYLVNTWIPFEPKMLLIFSGAFILLYALVWLSVYLSLKVTSRRLNDSIR